MGFRCLDLSELSLVCLCNFSHIIQSFLHSHQGSSKKNAKHNAAKNAIAEFQSKYHFERDSFFGELG